MDKKIIMLTNDELILAIEDIDTIWPETAGHLEYLKLDYMEGCITPYDTFFMNRICKAKLAGTDVEQEIEKVKAIYASKNKPFAWVVGPNSSPDNLAEKLLEAGFKDEGNNDALVLRNLDLQIDINDSLRIEGHDLDSLDVLVPVMSRGFGLTEQATKDYFYLLQSSAREIRSKIFTAYDKKSNQPIACGTLTYFNDRPIGILGGAATLPDHRGKGAYSGLVKARLEVALKDKLQAIVIAAGQESSSPICQKFGFEKLGEIHFYSYGKL